MTAVQILDEGIPKAFAIPTYAAKALVGTGPSHHQLLVAGLQRASGIQRTGATTANITFMLPNIIADAKRAALVSAAGPRFENPVDIGRFLAAHLAGAWSAANKNQFGKINRRAQAAIDAGVIDAGWRRQMMAREFDPFVEKGRSRRILGTVPQILAVFEDRW